jgi:prepilin-type processing-associated H-X9-DG protein
MDETNSNVQNQKPKTSKLAIVCVLIPLVLFVISLGFIELLCNENTSDFAMLLFLFIVAPGIYILPLNFLLGIYALIKIKKSKGLLKGYVLSIAGMLMSVLAFHYAMMATSSIRPEARIAHSKLEMIKVGKVLRVYSTEYENHYPTANKWCDLLVEHSDIEKTAFCLAAKQKWEKDSFQYAINPNCEPNSPSDMVLLFEIKGGWNKFGGPEILSIENHYRKGCNVLFNDGHAEFIKPKKIGQLKWGGKK